MYVSLSLMVSYLIFPILPHLCPCSFQFISASFLLPSVLIRGTPKRCRIIPVRSSKSFMSWEDTLARVLPALFPLYRYLHQLLGLAVSLFISTSLLSRFLTLLVFYSMFMFSFIMEPIGSAGDMTNTTRLCLHRRNTTQTPGSRSISRC